MTEARDLVEAHNRVFNERDWNKARDILSPDVETTSPGAGTMTGIEPFIGFAKGFVAALPDSRLVAETVIEDGARVVVEGRYTGRHTGVLVTPQGDVQGTGRKLDLPYADVFEVEAGRIVRHRTYYDQMELAQQLGLIPEPAASEGA